MKHPVHDSRAIANLFIKIWQKSSDGPLSIMSLLKYVYFAHGWTLGHTGQPLISHKVKAWKYGPVVPEVYYAYRGQSVYNIVRTNDKYPLKEELSPVQDSVINGVYREYSQLPAMELSALTHAEGTPWYRYRFTFYEVIPNKEIQRYYRKVVARLEKE